MMMLDQEALDVLVSCLFSVTVFLPEGMKTFKVKAAVYDYLAYGPDANIMHWTLCDQGFQLNDEPFLRLNLTGMQNNSYIIYLPFAGHDASQLLRLQNSERYYHFYLTELWNAHLSSNIQPLPYVIRASDSTFHPITAQNTAIVAQNALVNTHTSGNVSPQLYDSLLPHPNLIRNLRVYIHTSYPVIFRACFVVTYEQHIHNPDVFTKKSVLIALNTTLDKETFGEGNGYDFKLNPRHDTDSVAACLVEVTMLCTPEGKRSSSSSSKAKGGSGSSQEAKRRQKSSDKAPRKYAFRIMLYDTLAYGFGTQLRWEFLDQGVYFNDEVKPRIDFQKDDHLPNLAYLPLPRGLHLLNGSERYAFFFTPEYWNLSVLQNNQPQTALIHSSSLTYNPITKMYRIGAEYNLLPNLHAPYGQDVPGSVNQLHV